jgi:hypothetical protein
MLYATWTHQPDPDTRFKEWSEYVTTGNFLVGHIFGSILGTTLGILGVVSLGLYLADTKRSRMALVGTVAAVVGSGGVVAVFGVAASTQPALGKAFLGGLGAAQGLYQAVYRPTTLALAGTSVMLFSIGPILLGWAIASSGRLPKWTGLAYGASGPLVGIVGLIVGQAQTLGSILVITAGLAIAWRISHQWGGELSAAGDGARTP